jgi:MFS superfamily sulfate permease-like transporter
MHSVTCFFTFCVGIWHLIFRIAKLSLLSELLSDPIISGFSTGAAFVIGTR